MSLGLHRPHVGLCPSVTTGPTPAGAPSAAWPTSVWGASVAGLAPATGYWATPTRACPADAPSAGAGLTPTPGCVAVGRRTRAASADRAGPQTSGPPNPAGIRASRRGTSGRGQARAAPRNAGSRGRPLSCSTGPASQGPSLHTRPSPSGNVSRRMHESNVRGLRPDLGLASQCLTTRPILRVGDPRESDIACSKRPPRAAPRAVRTLRRGSDYSGARRRLPCRELDVLPCMDIVALLSQNVAPNSSSGGVDITTVPVRRVGHH